MSYTWNINWSGIFKKTKQSVCKVRCRLISTSSNTLSRLSIGSFRLSIESNTSRITNGFNVGNILVKPEIIKAGYYYLECNTLETEGFTMIIPNVDSLLTLSIYDMNETLMTNVPNYQVWLYFDVED